jgi:ribosome maturation factor RimP
MNTLSRTLSRCVAALLVCALLAPPMAFAAPKPLTPAQVHAHIKKLGAGNWVGVRLQTGVAFSGRIVSVEENSFALQRYGDTAATPVAYGDVAYVEMAISASRFSPKPLTAEAVRQRLLKRGLGNWVALQLENGVAFEGRIISIDENSFGLQLYGDPEVTPVAFSDVVYLQTGTPAAAAWILVGSFVATGVVVPAVAIHAMKNNQLKMPTMPTPPPTPIW